LTFLSHLADHADGDRVIANATLAARFVAEAALRRKESRGAHFRRDHPQAVERLARRSSLTLRGLELTAPGGAAAALAGATSRDT